MTHDDIIRMAKQTAEETGTLTPTEWNDRELLELAAKAAGYEYVKHTGCVVVDGISGNWNPLTDDGDALRLAVTVAERWRGLWIKMQADCIECLDRTSVSVTGMRSNLVEEWRTASDPYAATRRAIVRAAAEIGRQQEQPR